MQLRFARGECRLGLDDVGGQRRGRLRLLQLDLGIGDIGLGFVERRLRGGQIGLR